jgi:hypothetical protein
MLYEFLHLATKGLMFGTYVNIVNEVKGLRHSQDHVSYLDTLQHRLDQGVGHFDQRQPELFAEYYSPGEYHGMDLTTKVLKTYTFRYLESHEPYIQKSFQAVADQGGAADFTFKTARKIFAPKRAGKLFNASYTKNSLRGLIEMSRLTFTTGNAEIKQMIKRYRDSRINAGQPWLLRHEGDEGGDKVLWSKNFPELNDTVKKYKPPTVDGLVRAKIKPNEYIVITSIQEANDWAGAVAITLAGYQEPGVIYVGLDAEWNLHDGTRGITRTVQISFPVEIEEKVVVFDLTAMGVFRKDEFPKNLRDLLELPKIMVVGVKVSGDVDRLRNLGVRIQKCLDVGELAKYHAAGEPQGYSMTALAARYLSLGVDKSNQDSDWAQQPLPVALAEYCALDARLSHKLCAKILPKVKAAIEDNSSPTLEAISDLRIGSKVHLFQRGKVSAVATLVFVGKEGQQQKWGKMVIGKGKSLISLLHVKVPAAKPSFFFTPDSIDVDDGKVAWSRDTTTFMSLVQDAKRSKSAMPVVAVNTAQLKKYLSSVSIRDFQTPTRLEAVARTNIREMNEDSSETLEGRMEVDAAATTIDPPANEDMARPGTAKINGNSSKTDEGCMEVDATDTTRTDPASKDMAGVAEWAKQSFFATLDDVQEDYVEDVESDDESVDNGSPRSRDKSDIFHIFQNLSLPKTCPVRASISRLLIHATFEFDVDDYKAVTCFLARKRGIKTLEDILRHFYFNREWWRRRCRMYTPDPEAHARRIRLIHHYITDTEPLKEYYTDDLRKFLVGFEKECREGLFEELGDVALFQWDGKDFNGLDLSIRFRGSNRAENIHSKMSVAFGPWGVGARTAHFVLLLVSYRYNVHTGIRRCNDHNFGHTWLHYIDRIQSRILNIFGVDVYPRHMNLAQFQPIENFVAIVSAHSTMKMTMSNKATPILI